MHNLHLPLILFTCILIPLSLSRTPDETTSPDHLPITPVSQQVAPQLDQSQTTETTVLGAVITSPEPTLSARRISKCFHRGPEACPNEKETCRCKRIEDTASVVCCDVTDFLLKEGLNCANVGVTEDVTSLHIRNATLQELNVTLRNFRRLRSLSVTDGHIDSISGRFHVKTPIQCLNFSNNALSAIEPRVIVYLSQLEVFDISHNNLTEMPNLSHIANVTLDVSGNDRIPCQNLFKVRNNYTSNSSYPIFMNGNNTVCVLSKNFNWFNTTSHLKLSQVESVLKAQHDCLAECSCKFYRTDYVEGKTPRITFKVDCSGKQLTQMPAFVPENTIVLNITNNNITELVMEHPSYQDIRELYADNNQINSILSLEGTKFFDNFVALSLRNNKLKTIPSYVLSNIFDRNPNSRFIYLGMNSLQCDCHVAKSLKVWLLTKQKYILDFKEIMCENIPFKVIDLDPAKLCQDSQQHWTDYIYYIITAEVLLLMCLVLKVSYDYWVFKTAGYLPWPANKMPKLPCDWLCE